MEINEAYDLVNAPFVILEAYEEAEKTILEKCATVNQMALYAQLPLEHKQVFLKAIVNHVLVSSIKGSKGSRKG